MMVRKYLLGVEDGRGPLKSMFNLSIGCVDLMSVPIGGLWNRGFSSVHIIQEEHTFFTSLVE